MNTPREISNSDDIIDVRDVIARVEHLEPIREPGAQDLGDDNDTDQDSLFAELKTLESLLGDLKSYGGDEQWRGDWYPVTLVRDSHFTEYAEELVKDCGYINGDLPTWIAIDWEETAKNVRVDYSSVELDGITYWHRL